MVVRYTPFWSEYLANGHLNGSAECSLEHFEVSMIENQSSKLCTTVWKGPLGLQHVIATCSDGEVHSTTIGAGTESYDNDGDEAGADAV